MKTDSVPQAGAVAFRVVGGRPEILLVRAKKVPAHWIFPKGHLHKREEPRAAALRELAEEAGIVGEVVRPLVPTLTFTSGNEEVEVEYFLVVATGEVEPEEARDKIWLAPDDAIEKITHPDAQALLRSALPDIYAATAFGPFGRSERSNRSGSDVPDANRPNDRNENDPNDPNNPNDPNDR